jgi:hypothetical protein
MNHPDREERKRLNKFSEYLTGHTLILDDGCINNIRSYMNVIPIPSFKHIFYKYGLNQAD